jgi:hypothetical protein
MSVLNLSLEEAKEMLKEVRRLSGNAFNRKKRAAAKMWTAEEREVCETCKRMSWIDPVPNEPFWSRVQDLNEILEEYQRIEWALEDYVTLLERAQDDNEWLTWEAIKEVEGDSS